MRVRSLSHGFQVPLISSNLRWFSSPGIPVMRNNGYNVQAAREVARELMPYAMTRPVITALAPLSPKYDMSSALRAFIQVGWSDRRISYRRCRTATWAELLLQILVSALFLPLYIFSLPALCLRDSSLTPLVLSRGRFQLLTDFDGELLAEERHCG